MLSTTAGPTARTTYLRYDNAHGKHEKHVGERTEELESFPGVGALLRRFRAEVAGPGATDFPNEDRRTT